MADIRVAAVTDKRGFADFLSVPRLAHANDPLWIEPLRFERKLHFETHNPFFEHAEHLFFVAYRDGRPAGRISAQIDSLTQNGGKNAMGHFGLIEATDATIVPALLGAAEDWLRARGATRVAGPFNLSINDECGLLVRGFDTPPAMLMSHDLPWMGEAIEACGYAKAKDLIAYTLDLTKPLPPIARTMAERAAALPGIAERAMDAGDFRAELDRVLAIFNAAWSANWGFVPMTQNEVAYMAKNLKPVLAPDWVRLVEKDGEAIGMIVCLPDVNQAIDGLHGRLLPFGWLRLLWRLKVRKVRHGRVLLMGVKPEHRDGVQGAAIAVLLIGRLWDAVQSAGMRRMELSWILEDNEPVKRVIEMVGGVHYKTYRIYEKPL